MMQGIIERAQRSKSGKSLRVLVNGQWYSTNNWALEQCIGRTIQFEVGTSEYMGSTVFWANDAELVTDVAAPEPQHPQHPQQGGGQQVKSSSPPPKQMTASVENMAFMPFVSNTVAHAIQAGAIKNPEDIYAWAYKAFNTAKNLVEGKQEVAVTAVASDDFDDDIPF